LSALVGASGCKHDRASDHCLRFPGRRETGLAAVGYDDAFGIGFLHPSRQHAMREAIREESSLFVWD
jgi:hypothetical protein